MNNFSIDFIQQRISLHRRRTVENDSLVRSAVLVPFVETGGGLSLLFTKRTDTIGRHKGQISFPGGVEDKNDDSPVATALRESFEEIGIPSPAIQIFGLLNDFQTPSRFLVTPVVGYVEQLPALCISKNEVAEVLMIPFAEFFDASKCRSEIRLREGKKIEIFFYDVWKEPIWGVTGHIIKEMIDLLSG
jgi:8-oxo-dGTP pyrophosphatase MutT (NUDIX family)